MVRVTCGRAGLWRRGVLGVVIVVVSLLTGVGPVQASNAVVGAITGFGGKCVDVPGGSTVNGTQVQLWTCNETMAQQWTLAGDGTIRALGMCLDVYFAGTANGTPVVLANCNGSVAQQWVVSGSSGLRNPHANACLDATGISSADGTPLQIWSCTGTANQQWVLPIAKTYVVPLTSDFDVPARIEDDDTYTVMLSHTITLKAGEARLVTDQFAASVSGGGAAVVENNIVCVDAVTGVQAATASTSGINLFGPLTVPRTPTVPPTITTLHNSLLFRAPYAGTYRCELLTYTSDGNRLGYHVTAYKRALSGGTWTGTWLEFSPVDEVGSQMWINGPCPIHGDDALNCVYMDGSSSRSVKNVFEIKGASPAPWVAPADAVAAKVRWNMMLTSCPHGTDSCIPAFWGGSDFAGFNTHLEFNQLWPSGGVCNVNSTPDQPNAIYNSVHHFPVNYSLDVPISPNCGGSRTFQLRAMLSYRDGNPFKIDGSSLGANSTDNVTVTVVRAASGGAVTVPRVVGSSLEAAKTALTNARLATGTVTQVSSTVPLGTVLAQNAAAESVEPASSQVDLTVSAGTIGGGCVICAN